MRGCTVWTWVLTGFSRHRIARLGEEHAESMASGGEGSVHAPGRILVYSEETNNRPPEANLPSPPPSSTP